MIYGYVRVATDAQDLASQLAALKAAGCEKLFYEKLTGANVERPQFKKLMAILSPGDMVLIPAVDRLARDMTDLLVLARDIQRTGAGLHSLAEPALDMTSEYAEIMLAVIGFAASLKRKNIRARTARGRADAKAQGMKLSRKPKFTPHQQREAAARLQEGEPQRSIARSYNVHESTIARL